MSWIKLGVLAFRPKSEVINKWQPLVDSLNRSLGEEIISLAVLNYPEPEQASANGDLDFVLPNPAHYVQMTFHNGLSSPLATRVPVQQGHIANGFGGVILTLESRADLNRFRCRMRSWSNPALR